MSAILLIGRRKGTGSVGRRSAGGGIGGRIGGRIGGSAGRHQTLRRGDVRVLEYRFLARMITTLLIQCVEDIRSNASTLGSQVDSAKAAWDDVNYERIAQGAAAAIAQGTQAFCTEAHTDAELIYMSMLTIESLLNDL